MSGPSVILASASPRRGELLSQIDVSFEVVTTDVEEIWDGEESAQHYVERLALAKARAGANQSQHGLPVIGADTAVVIDDEILGKPEDREQAMAMLGKLSGRCHQVYSAVAIVGSVEQIRTSISSVSFRPIRPEEAEIYWQTGEPKDKAGAYAIQGLGAVFISRLDGSYSGVMGLPLFETTELLKAAGVQLKL